MEKLAFIVGISVTLVMGPQQAAEMIEAYGQDEAFVYELQTDEKGR